jgi:hypothetical protein
MNEFIPGLELGEAFYWEAVRPALDSSFPGLPHAAALIGSGSEILGFDTPMSSDHHWGPRAMLFLNDADYEQYADAIRETLRHQLPYTFYGYATSFTPPNPDDNGTQLMQPVDQGPVNHRVEVMTLRSFLWDYLAYDPDEPLTVEDWLTFPQQRLRTVVGGAVYHDDIGLNAMRDQFFYYPHDVWLYLLACGWVRIGQEEPFVGRAGTVGDELGSHIIASRLARDVMMLGFLMERQYAPYSKWFGTAFSRLACAEHLTPHLWAALQSEDWPTREGHLARAYETLAEMHNALDITPPVTAKVSSFWGRPFQVIHGEAIADVIRAQIQDETVRRIPTNAGSVDQFSDSTDILSDIRARHVLKQLYR